MSDASKGPPTAGAAPDRRTFLKRAAGAVPAAAALGGVGLAGCDLGSGRGEGGGQGGELPPGALEALAETLLPSASLGPEGTARAVEGFRAWIGGFEAGAELDHPYLDDRIRYGPDHPGPRWAEQLIELDHEARRRSGLAFAELPAPERTALVEEALSGEDVTNLPGSPAGAEYVAVGLLAWFYGTAEANDLCYQRSVGRHQCRGIEGLEAEPAAVPAEQAAIPAAAAPVPAAEEEAS